MFIVNIEGAIRKDNKWIIIERSKKEEHAGGLLSLVGGKVEANNMPSVLESNLQRKITEEISDSVDAPDYLKQYVQLANHALNLGLLI